MTLGEKIRKYRLLLGKTQKQIGEALGFKKASAVVRINQYETNKMAPKTEIRTALAKALDVDMEALSDINVQSYTDLMYIFFEMEEKLGVEVRKEKGKTALIFDDNNERISTLISYLNFWKSHKELFIPDKDSVTEEQEHAYQVWKSHFQRNIDEYFQDKLHKIDEFYTPRIETVRKEFPFEKRTSPVTLLIRSIIDSGVNLKVIHSNLVDGPVGFGYTFKINQLLDPPSEESATLIARFLSELYHYKDLGAYCPIDMQLVDNSPTITYYISVPSLDIIGIPIRKYLEFKESANAENELSKEMFERKFKFDVESYWNDIEEEIERYKSTTPRTIIWS